MDDFMVHCWKMGFARLWVELNSSKSLKLGISIQGHKEIFGNLFVHENMQTIYYQCSKLGHVVDNYTLH